MVVVYILPLLNETSVFNLRLHIFTGQIMNKFVYDFQTIHFVHVLLCVELTVSQQSYNHILGVWR